MRWGRKKTRDEDIAIAEPISTYWADRFSGIGSRLDDSNHNLNEVAVSITGSEIRISALGWDPSAQYNGWFTVFAEMIDEEVPLDPARSHGVWEHRLLGVGAFLDARDHAVFSPCVLAVDDGLLINALINTSDSFEPISWRLKGGQSA